MEPKRSIFKKLLFSKFYFKSAVRSQSTVSPRCTQSTSSGEIHVKSPFPDVSVPNIPLHKYIWQNLSKWPHHTAIECAVTGKKYTYNEIQSRSRKFGRSLTKLGMSKGDTVAIMLPNVPEFPVALLGSLECGVVPTTLNPNLTKRELIYQLDHAKVKAIICHPSHSALLHEIQQTTKEVFTIITTSEAVAAGDGKVLSFDELIDNASVVSSEDHVDMEDTALIAYSSGTTGLPKATCLSHRALTSSLVQLSSTHIRRVIQTHGNHQDVVPGILPLYHIYGQITVMMTALYNGAKIVTLPKFNEKSFLNILENNSNIMLFVAPPIVFNMGKNKDVTQKHFEGIRELMTSAAPCSASDIEKVIGKSSNRVVFSQGYGLSEATTILTVATYKDSKDFSTVGPLVPNVMCKVVSQNDGSTLLPNTPGELCFKGHQIMKGYLDNVKATNETLDSDGWLRSGDIGYYNEEGSFYITDRIKEMIKVKGFQVAPAELEGVLRNHSGVLDAAVVGVPCNKSGETPVAFVQVKPGTKLTEQDLMPYLSSQLARYKMVSSIRFIEEIPKSPSGKILRRHLKSMVH